MAAGTSVLAGGVVSGGTLAGTLLSAAIGGAVGSIAAQGVSIATGLQDKFSWSQVGISAAGAAVTSGISGSNFAQGLMKSVSVGGQTAYQATWSSTAARAITGNVVSQGISVATGMQDKFSWSAVAGVGAALSHGSGELLKNTIGKTDAGTAFLNSPTGKLVSGTLGGVVNGLAQGAVIGFNKVNWGAVAASAFGNALGDSITEQIAQNEAEQNPGSGLASVPDDVASVDEFMSRLNDNVSLTQDANLFIDQSQSVSPEALSHQERMFQALTTVLREVDLTADTAEGVLVADASGKIVPKFEHTNPRIKNQFGGTFVPAVHPEEMQAFGQSAATGVADSAYDLAQSIDDVMWGSAEALTMGGVKRNGVKERNIERLKSLMDSAEQMAHFAPNALQITKNTYDKLEESKRNREKLRSKGKYTEAGASGYVYGYTASNILTGLIGTSLFSKSKIQSFAAHKVRLSQKTVSYNKVDRVTQQPYTYDDIVRSMRKGGWQGEPVDVVRMPDGKLTSMDNTRVTAAREAGIKVQAIVHSYDEALTKQMQSGRGWKRYNTWGEALKARINSQENKFSTTNPHGATQSPRITGRP